MCRLPVNAVTLITRIALEEERTECGNMSFEQNLQEKLLALADRVRDETMVGLGVRFEDKGGKSTWKLDDPEVLQREHDEKIQRDKEKLLQKDIARRELEERKQNAREQKLQRKQQQQAQFVSSSPVARSFNVTRLYPTDPKDNNEATFDVIFFHGLEIDAGTDYENAWRNKANILWPQKWLPEDLENIQVFSVSYDAEVAKWIAEDNIEDVEDIGKNLLENVVM
jgi:hypothetical protein